MLENLTSRVVIRPCQSNAEWTECVKLQSRVWEYSDAELLPSAVFAIAAQTGGQVIGAFLDNHLIGFSLALVGYQDRVRYLHSNTTVVLPEFQDKGVGTMLKLAQRQDGIGRGFDHMEWTFDPLQIRNANFGIVRLGAIARMYLPNFYGLTSSPLHRGMPTDRLLAEWWWTSSRVQSILKGEPPVQRETKRVSIPSGTVGLSSQAYLRDQFEALFHDGWTISSFEQSGTTGAYILTHGSVID